MHNICENGRWQYIWYTYSTNITKIDKVLPTDTAPIAVGTSSTIVVTNNQTDADSGIKSTKYALKTGTSWGAWQDSNTFTGLIKNTSYEVKTLSTDYAGNTAESKTKQISTTSIPGATTGISGNISFTSNPSTWTNGSVSTSITTSIKNYTIQYQIGATTGTWIDYSGAILSNENCTIYVRLFDGNEGGNYTSITITNIDKVAPTGSFNIASNSSESISVTVTSNDEGGSGIKGYYYSADNGATYTNISTENTYTYTGLTRDTYYIKVKVEDNAGNVKIFDTITKNFIYTVTYYNGTVASTKQVAMNTNFNETASRSGYTFVGWNTEKNTSNYQKGYVITQDTTLYAVFSNYVSRRNKRGFRNTYYKIYR